MLVPLAFHCSLSINSCLYWWIYHNPIHFLKIRESDLEQLAKNAKMTISMARLQPLNALEPTYVPPSHIAATFDMKQLFLINMLTQCIDTGKAKNMFVLIT
jgi:hypothetical protein